MDDAEVLAELLEIMREHDLERLKLQVGKSAFELERETQAPPAAAPSAEARAAEGSGLSAPPANVMRVTAPLVGVFYRSPAPGSEPFVSVGDRVAAGQVVCILEAMKLMNDIQSEHAGVVTRILPENGELVALGEDLFWIEP